MRGKLCAGTSTGGMTNKPVGRIGDSPIIGAGTYANVFFFSFFIFHFFSFFFHFSFLIFFLPTFFLPHFFRFPFPHSLFSVKHKKDNPRAVSLFLNLFAF